MIRFEEFLTKSRRVRESSDLEEAEIDFRADLQRKIPRNLEAERDKKGKKQRTRQLRQLQGWRQTRAPLTGRECRVWWCFFSPETHAPPCFILLPSFSVASGRRHHPNHTTSHHQPPSATALSRTPPNFQPRDPTPKPTRSSSCARLCVASSSSSRAALAHSKLVIWCSPDR
ncbi:hypothetical protein Droror1_Dr00003297 [Drosera rotundifolia]